MSHFIKHVGLDVHKDTIAVAIADAGVAEPRWFGQIANTPQAVAKLAQKLTGPARKLQFWYEAGPCGYGLWRHLTELGHACQVVAPSRIPRRSGDRIKTDRRDAMNLARLGRAGELSGVQVPDTEQELMRELTRCREDAKQMQRQHRQQLSSFLLRHGRVYRDGTKWTQRYFYWLSLQKFEPPLQQIVFEDYVQAVHRATERVQQLERQIEQACETWSRAPLMQALMALRGIDRLTAVTVLAELGDLRRFNHPRQLMGYLGLVPSEHSSGSRQRRGAITKTGNAHVRRVLVESAWSYRFPARQTMHLKCKADKAPAEARAIAWKAQKRLCRRYRELLERGKLHVQACTAIARELVGFIWAIVQAVMDSGTDSLRGEPSNAVGGAGDAQASPGDPRP